MAERRMSDAAKSAGVAASPVDNVSLRRSTRILKKKKATAVPTKVPYDRLAKWRTKEKDVLLNALKKRKACDQFCYGSLQHVVRTRSKAQVKHFVECLRRRAMKTRIESVKKLPPVQIWDMLLTDLGDSDQDNSKALAKVLVMASAEVGTRPDQLRTDDFKPIKVYRYLASLVRGTELPKLTPLESQIVLDCFNHVTETLKASNIHEQASFLKSQYLSLYEKLFFGVDGPSQGDRDQDESDDEDHQSTSQSQPGTSQAPSGTNETEAGTSQAGSGGGQSRRKSTRGKSRESSGLQVLNPLHIPVRLLEFTPKEKMAADHELSHEDTDDEDTDDEDEYTDDDVDDDVVVADGDGKSDLIQVSSNLSASTPNETSTSNQSKEAIVTSGQLDVTVQGSDQSQPCYSNTAGLNIKSGSIIITDQLGASLLQSIPPSYSNKVRVSALLEKQKSHGTNKIPSGWKADSEIRHSQREDVTSGQSAGQSSRRDQSQPSCHSNTIVPTSSVISKPTVMSKPTVIGEPTVISTSSMISKPTMISLSNMISNSCIEPIKINQSVSSPNQTSQTSDGIPLNIQSKPSANSTEVASSTELVRKPAADQSRIDTNKPNKPTVMFSLRTKPTEAVKQRLPQRPSKRIALTPLGAKSDSDTNQSRATVATVETDSSKERRLSFSCSSGDDTQPSSPEMGAPKKRNRVFLTVKKSK